MSVHLLEVEPTDVDASALGLLLDAPAPPVLAQLVIETIDGALTLGVLGASHVVIARSQGEVLTEQVSCDAVAAGGDPLPRTEIVGPYEFESITETVDRAEFDTAAIRLMGRASEEGWICGAFPGDESALTVLTGSRAGQGWVWQSWHLYPGEGTGVIVKTSSRWHP